MSRQLSVVLYVVAMVAAIVGVDFALFRNRFWERLIVNIGIVLFLRHPRAPGCSSLSRPQGFPCCVRFPCVHAVATTPAQRLGASSARFLNRVSLPRYGSQVGPRVDLF
jgi:hypothetical protein